MATQTETQNKRVKKPKLSDGIYAVAGLTTTLAHGGAKVTTVFVEGGTKVIEDTFNTAGHFTTASKVYASTVEDDAEVYAQQNRIQNQMKLKVLKKVANNDDVMAKFEDEIELEIIENMFG